MADGTRDSGETVEGTITTQEWLDAYWQGRNLTTNNDLWNVGNSLLKDNESTNETVSELTTSFDTHLETEEKEIQTIDQKVAEIQCVLAQMIFELNDIGINFTEKIENFRNKYLNNGN